MFRQESGIPAGILLRNGPCQVRFRNSRFQELPRGAPWGTLAVKKASGGMGEQFQRRYWNPHWIRVAEEDEAMKIGPWVARKRKAFWEARFAVAVANCNARMIRVALSIRITDRA